MARNPLDREMEDIPVMPPGVLTPSRYAHTGNNALVPTHNAPNIRNGNGRGGWSSQASNNGMSDSRVNNVFIIGNMEAQRRRDNDPSSSSSEEAEMDLIDHPSEAETNPEGSGDILIMGMPVEESVVEVLRTAQSCQHCYGCNVFVKKTKKKILASDILSIWNLIEKYVGCLPPLVLTEQVYEKYEKARLDWMRKNNFEDCPYPKWTKGTIYEHLTGKHRNIAQLWPIVTARKLDGVIDYIYDNCIRVVDPQTGQAKVDPRQVSCLLQCIKEAKTLRMTPRDRFVHGNAGMEIDTEMENKIMLTRNMNILNNLK